MVAFSIVGVCQEINFIFQVWNFETQKFISEKNWENCLSNYKKWFHFLKNFFLLSDRR
jgi:hypothetical protein